MDPWQSNLAAAVRQFASGIAEVRPSLNQILIAQYSLAGAAYSIENGDLSQGALRLYLACRDLYTAIGEADLHHQMPDKIGETLRHKPTVYLDTNIISGMIKRDLGPDDADAIEKILDAFQADFIDLRTSDVAQRELDRIPDEHRESHTRLFRLLKLSCQVEGSNVAEGSEAQVNIRLKQCRRIWASAS